MSDKNETAIAADAFYTRLERIPGVKRPVDYVARYEKMMSKQRNPAHQYISAHYLHDDIHREVIRVQKLREE